MGFEPQHAGCFGRIYPGSLPPRGFIAAPMNLAMMASAQRDGELVADLAAKGAGLRKAEVVRVRRLAAADQARLLGDC